jgi:predicted transcriptional regulator of viral defense system
MPARNPAFRPLLRRPVVSLQDATAAYSGDRRAAAQALYALQRSGLLVKVRRGVYVPGPRQDPGWETSWDPYLVAARLRPEATIAFHSAFVIDGVAQNPSESRIHVAVSSRVAPFSFQGVGFEPHLIPARLLEKASSPHPREGEVIRATRPEWTIAMCCRHPPYGAGFEEIAQSISGYRHVDPSEVLDACRAIGTSSIFNRAGFLLSLNRAAWGIQPSELKRFQERMSRSPAFFDSRNEETLYVHAWRLLVPRSAREVAGLGRY